MEKIQRRTTLSTYSLIKIIDMKNSMTFNLDFTLSKIMGTLIVLGGVALGFYLKSESVAISLIGIGSAMITVKTLVQQNRK